MTDNVVSLDGSAVSNVVELSVSTTLDIPASRVLKAATEADLDEVLVIGHLANGEFYVACSSGLTGHPYYLMEKAKAHILRCDAEE